MLRGKIRLDKNFLSTLSYHLKDGWALSGVTVKDEDGYYWFVLEKVDSAGVV